MPLSALQKFILKECLAEKGKVLSKKFLRFYQNQSKPPSKLEQVKIVSKSLDRLIKKGLLVGFGEQTQFKWFIREAQLTRPGARLARKLLGEQVKLPFKK